MILVTGAGGLIGSAVSKFFLKKNFQVIGIEIKKEIITKINNFLLFCMYF